MKYYILAVILSLVVFGCVTPSEAPSENVTNETPVVEQVSCKDSDGLNESTRGYVTIGSKTYNDSCDDNTTVKEYFCDGTSLGIRQFSCAPGSVCDDGHCVIKETEPEPVEIKKCIETDGGENYTVYGSVNYGGKIYHDICQGSYDLLEYFCKDDVLKQATHHCAEGEKCDSGACMGQEKSCSDSDGGSPLSKGTTTQYGGGVVVFKKTDSCIDNESRTEYYCDGDAVKNKTEDCPKDTYCSSGACISLCSDSDSGKKYSTAGITKGQSGAFGDYCKDDETLVEYYCSGNSVMNTTYDCLYCYEGECLSSSEVSCKESGKRTYLQYDKEKIAEKNDSCVGYTKMKDYFCMDDEIHYQVNECEDDEICYGGSCNEIVLDACYDLDYDDSEGDEYVKSMIVITENGSVKNTKEDECLNDITLMEYMCDGDFYRVEYHACASDERCSDGACMYPYTCTDSDGGIALKYGTVALWDGDTKLRSEDDKCTGDDKIFEGYCEDDRIKYTALACPSGMSCESGECK